MLKLMLVDDEPIVRDGIRHSIPWEQHGLTITAEAGDGESALAAAVQAHPDIVICDVRMPIADGFTFIQNMKRLLPHVRIILLTAYAEQAYMIQAIRLGASDFLVKPAGLSQILKAVLRVKQEIEAERMEALLMRKRNDLVNENINLFRTHCISALLEGKQPVSSLREAIEVLKIDLPGPAYAVALAQPAADRTWLLMQELATALSAFRPIMTQVRDRGYVVVILNVCPDTFFHDMQRIARDVLAHSDNLTGALALSPVVGALDDIATLYATTSAAMRRWIWYEKGSLLMVGDDGQDGAPDTVAIEAICTQFMDVASRFSPNTPERDAASCFDELAALRLPYDQFQQRITHLAEHAQLLHGVKPSFSCADEPLAALRERFVKAASALGDKDMRFGMGHVGRALRYMEQHFDQDLSLETVAEALYISPTYLSRILNEKTQRGFIGWLRHFRIEKSKELLGNTSMRHYDIAEKVGYNSYKIFSEHFQEETGVSAKEWRSKQVPGAGLSAQSH